MRSWKKKASASLAVSLLTASILPMPGHALHAAEVETAAPANTTTNTIVDQQTTGHVHATFQTALSSASVQNDTYAITTARAQAIGSTVTVQGVVTYREDTGNNYSNLYIQDGQAGIVIRGQAFTAQAGDTIQVTGKLGAYQKLLQIAATSSNVETIQSGTVPQPKTIDSSGFATGNPNEATLVKVSQVHVDSVSGNRYTLSDANGTFVVYTTNAWLKSGYTYTSITGVITRYQDTYQLLPRSTSDIEGGDQAPPSGQEPLRLTINQIQGTAQTSTYAEQQVQGVEGIVTMVKSRSSFYMQMPDGLADNDPRTSEGILVYRSAHGVKLGDRVQVDGSVKEYRETGYADAADLTTTEIAASSIKVLAENQPLPAPTIIGPGGRSIPEQIASVDGKAPFDPAQYSIDFYESLEGMRVQLNDADIIGPYTYEIPVTVDAARHARRTPAGGLIITDRDFNSDRLLIASKPSQPIKTGDRFNGAITGIMSYSYSNFKILPDQPLPPVQDGGWKREVSQLQNGPQQLTIASFNVENFWNDPAATDKTQKIARDVVDNLHTPDILALMEVQDNNGATDDGTTDASQNFEALIAAIQAAGGPTYRYASIAPINNQDGGAPGGNIRVGFLYNPQRVTLPIAPGGAGDSVTAVTYGATGLSVNPGRIDPGNAAFEASRKSLAAQFVFNGQSVIVIANHFNSKGGDQALYGAAQPPVRSSEIQRARQAAILNNFVKDTLAQNSSANIVLVGDFNDFQFSNTFNILKGKELTNLVDTLPVNERYSYVYEGNSQTLDHVLMTSQLAARAQLDIVHINSDFMEEDGRVSDHDPLLTRIDFTPKSDSKDKDKDRGTTTTPGTNTNTDAAPSGGAGTAPITPTASSEPVAQGVSENGQLARWTITPELQQEGNRMVATSVIDAAAAQRMLNNTATTLQLDLQATSAVNSFQLHIQQAAGTALTSQSQLQQITINTPLGQYHLPASLVKQALTNVQTLELEISSDPAAVQEAQAAGYTPYAAVAYTINTIAANGNKTAVRELGQYVKRTIASNAIQTGQRIAVMRLEQNSTGKVQYTPVPFSIQSGQITLLSNTNSSYIALRAEEHAFRDMQGHWAQAVVQQLRDTGVIQGQSNTQFTPTAGVTRAEFAAMLTRALGVSTLANVSSSSNTSFADVPASAWYASSVQAATNAGWIKGDEKGDFRPNAQVTRQEMAVMLQRAWSDVMTNSNNTSTNTDNSNTSSQRLTDTATIASWAQPAVQQLVTAGLIEGNAEARFQPTRSLSRAESAAVISRLINEITRS